MQSRRMAALGRRIPTRPSQVSESQIKTAEGGHRTDVADASSVCNSALLTNPDAQISFTISMLRIENKPTQYSVNKQPMKGIPTTISLEVTGHNGRVASQVQ